MPVEKMADFFNKRLDGFEAKMLSAEEAGIFYPLSASLLPRFPGAEILDLGCGTGLELDEYFPLAPDAHVTGIDLAGDLLLRLKEKHPDKNLTLIQDSYFDVDFGKETFDGVISVESLHHFKRDMKVQLYKKIKDALVPGGVYVETDYAAADDETEKAKFEEAARRRREENIPDDVFVHLDTPHTSKHIMEMHKEAGFDETELIYDKAVAIIVSRKAK